MNVHDKLDTEALEAVSLYALGAMESKEIQAYEEHLTRCAACRSELDSMSKIVHEIGLCAPEAEPPTGLKQRLIAKARAAKPTCDEHAHEQTLETNLAKTGVFLQGFDFVRSSEGDWEPTEFTGIAYRMLHMDSANKRLTLLLKMEPGACYPRHRHTGSEECYVLEGDIHFADIDMQAGDYQFAQAGSLHPAANTKAGCLLLLKVSPDNELVA